LVNFSLFEDGTLKMDDSILRRQELFAVPTSVPGTRPGLFSPTSVASRRRHADSPESYVSTSSPECLQLSEDEEDQDFGPRSFYSGLWSPSEDPEVDVKEEVGEEAEEPPRKRRRFANGSPTFQVRNRELLRRLISWSSITYEFHSKRTLKRLYHKKDNHL
jgi:hypothetical protein